MRRIIHIVCTKSLTSYRVTHLLTQRWPVQMTEQSSRTMYNIQHAEGALFSSDKTARFVEHRKQLQIWNYWRHQWGELQELEHPKVVANVTRINIRSSVLAMAGIILQEGKSGSLIITILMLLSRCILACKILRQAKTIGYYVPSYAYSSSS